MPPSTQQHQHHHHPHRAAPSHHPQHQQQQQQQQQQRRGGGAALASPPASIPDNRLGLSAEDVATLREAQQRVHSQVRSPAGSQASSQGRLLLDPNSLALLSRHFDQVMVAISQRLEQLNHMTEIATDAQVDRAGNAIQMADREIARFRALLQQIDELEMELDKIKRIREIVRGFRVRVEQMEARLG